MVWRKYELLTSLGIDGFWNDMNEPAIFYSEEGIRALNQAVSDHVKTFGADAMVDNPDAIPFEARGILERIQNNPEDYKRFYHNVNGTMIRHDLVHNLYGYNMTRAAGEALRKIAPDKTCCCSRVPPTLVCTATAASGLEITSRGGRIFC